MGDLAQYGHMWDLRNTNVREIWKADSGHEADTYCRLRTSYRVIVYNEHKTRAQSCLVTGTRDLDDISFCKTWPARKIDDHVAGVEVRVMNPYCRRVLLANLERCGYSRRTLPHMSEEQARRQIEAQ